MKFSKYISKAVTPVMALFQKQHGCLSNKATTICGYSVCSLRQVPVRHNRGGKSTENKVRFAPPTMCRLTNKHTSKDYCFQTLPCKKVCKCPISQRTDFKKSICFFLWKKSKQYFSDLHMQLFFLAKNIACKRQRNKKCC